MTNPYSQATILCDFDGTITPFDLADFIFRRFAACGLFYSNQWAQGLIDTREEILRTLDTITARPAEIDAALADIPIDPTFLDLVAFSRRKGIALAIVSDGMDWPIDVVLKAHGIQGLPIYANHIIFEGEKITCEFPFYHPSTPLVGVCKPIIVSRYHQNGGKVIYIGDGRTDHEAAREADKVFAKKDLADFCRQQGIPASVFSSFAEIIAEMENWFSKMD